MARLVLRAAAPVPLAPAVRAALLLDGALGLALAAWGLVGLSAGSGLPWPWIRTVYGLLVVGLSVASAAGRPRAPLWRRRVMWAGALAVLLAGRPGPTLESGAVVLWHGGLVVAQLLAGREVSRAVSRVTGEESLPEA